MRGRMVWLMLLGSAQLLGSFNHLIPTADGSAVFVDVKTGFTTTESFRLQMDQGRPVLTSISGSIADANVDGSMIATSFYAPRRCGFAGSTCFLAAPCQAGFSVTGPGIDVAKSGRRTLIRLNRSGSKAWIEQSDACPDLVVRNPPEFQGLYELPGLTPVIPARGAKLANARAGRRLITSSDQVLVFAAPANIQLALLDAAGVHPIRHQYGAAEAVIDAQGTNVVYVDGAPFGRLHWIDLARQTEDDLDAFGVFGTAPAISADGRTLVFLDSRNHLQLYRRDTRTLTPLDAGAVNEFVLADNGQAVLEEGSDGGLVRVDLASARVETWLDPFPEIQDVSALSDVPFDCPLPCYFPQQKRLLLSPASIVILGGRFLDQPGWRVRIGDRDVALQPVSGNAAWFQAPADLRTVEMGTLTLFKPGFPLQFSTRTDVASQLVTCLGTLHQSFDGIVSNDNPAQVGEAVHVFLTGLQGTEPVAVGVPNPSDPLVPIASPPLLNPNSGYSPLFFGLAPGLVGIQQLDLSTQQSSAQNPTLFADSVRQLHCDAPPIAP